VQIPLPSASHVPPVQRSATTRKPAKLARTSAPNAKWQQTTPSNALNVLRVTSKVASALHAHWRIVYSVPNKAMTKRAPSVTTLVTRSLAENAQDARMANISMEPLAKTARAML